MKMLESKGVKRMQESKPRTMEKRRARIANPKRRTTPALQMQKAFALLGHRTFYPSGEDDA